MLSTIAVHVHVCEFSRSLPISNDDGLHVCETMCSTHSAVYFVVVCVLSMPLKFFCAASAAADTNAVAAITTTPLLSLPPTL